MVDLYRGFESDIEGNMQMLLGTLRFCNALLPLVRDREDYTRVSARTLRSVAAKPGVPESCFAAVVLSTLRSRTSLRRLV
ncbi:MAG TPA: hypothetical protein VKK79_01485 [Candidatus Lokiarchaeia archaeon]|nr:hypothetical protein [Candidatus Lokiarchaeia archaeon]